MSHTIESAPLTTPSRVKAYAKRRYLNFDYDVRYPDEILTEMISEAQKDIEAQTGHIFNAQNIRQTWHGEDLYGGTLLQTKFSPILLEDNEGTTLPVTLTINNTEQNRDNDYHITNQDPGTIHTETQLPTTGYNNVVLEYTAGQDPPHPSAQALCEAMVVYTMYTERETPPSIQNIIQESSDDGTTKVDRADKILPVIFDIQGKFRKLPRKLFLGIIEV